MLIAKTLEKTLNTDGNKKQPKGLSISLLSLRSNNISHLSISTEHFTIVGSFLTTRPKGNPRAVSGNYHTSNHCLHQRISIYIFKEALATTNSFHSFSLRKYLVTPNVTCVDPSRRRQPLDSGQPRCQRIYVDELGPILHITISEHCYSTAFKARYKAIYLHMHSQWSTRFTFKDPAVVRVYTMGSKWETLQ